MLRSLFAIYTPVLPAAAEPAVARIVIYATAITLTIGLIGRFFGWARAAWRAVHRLEQAAAIFEQLPEWKDAVDDDRARLHDGLEWVGNLAEGIARELGINVRGRPQ